MRYGMKINNDILRSFYKKYISTNISKGICPSTEKMLTFYENKISNRERKKIIDHISKCEYCAKEIALFKKTLLFEKHIKNELFELAKDFKKNTYTKPRSSHVFLKNVILTSSALFVLILIFLSVFQNINKISLRGNHFNRIEIVFPKNIIPFTKDIIFKWNSYSGSDFFIVEIFNSDFSLFWRSKKIYFNKVSLPKKILDEIIYQKKYYWMVTAYLDDGYKIESELCYFEIDSN